MVGAVEVAMTSARNASDVFLLGAGFARAISPTMPLLQDLAARVRKAYRGAGRVPVEVAGMMTENFAHALSYLEQAKPWVTEAENLRHRALFLDISNAIACDLDDTVVRAIQSLGSDVPSWLQRLIHHWHDRRCIVVSVNYDTLIESVAANVSLPNGERIIAADIY